MQPETIPTISITSRTMDIHDTIQKILRKEIGIATAAATLGLCERQIYRLLPKVQKHGLRALTHGNCGKQSGNAFSEKEIEKVKDIITERYRDFGPTLAAEKLASGHKVIISREKLRTLMRDWGFWKARTRKSGERHEWRERRSLFGELQQFDGCYHPWFEKRGDSCCLLASIDDATGTITGAMFVDWEGVFPSFSFWREYFTTLGKPCSIYLDRHSTYKINAKTLRDDPEARSQFERAMHELNVEVIHAYSPEAKGRIERLFKTLQDRLVKELRLEGISTRDEANDWVRTVFVPAFNAQFSVIAKNTGDAHRPVTETVVTLDRIFSSRVERVVMNDFTVAHKGVYRQLEKTSIRLVRPREKVEIEQRPDGTSKIYLRGAYLPFHVLPARPTKVTTHPPKRLEHVPTKPAADHPWRKFKFSSQKENEEPTPALLTF
jgi:hypothetical protein